MNFLKTIKAAKHNFHIFIETVFGYDTIFREVKINVHSRAENISTRKELSLKTVKTLIFIAKF